MNIVIPDDARELERDVLAYRREMRAKRRRQRVLRLLRPFNRPGLGGPTAIVPLIALCLAIALVGGALLSVVTMNPANAPTVTPSPTEQAAGPSALPTGNVRISGHTEPVSSLASSVLALVPAGCACGQQLDRLATQTAGSGVPLYFVGDGVTSQQLAAETVAYGHGYARAVDDPDGALARTYDPVGLTVLLVYSDAKAEVRRNLGSAFELASVLGGLKSSSSEASAEATPKVRAGAG